jgi:hypothetical protein
MYMCLSQVLRRKNISFYFNFNTHINSKFSIRPNQGLKFSKKMTVYIFTFVHYVLSISQILVFYSKQVQVAFNAYGTNWNSTGYFESNAKVGKYR